MRRVGTEARGCLNVGPGRGDCAHYLGRVQETDEYGVREGWCIVCHHMARIETLEQALGTIWEGVDSVEEAQMLARKAFLESRSHVPDCADEANARLIAAAPEMLHALTTLSFHCTPETELEKKALELAFKAIRRAHGEDST
jgi:hypothetical protein